MKRWCAAVGPKGQPCKAKPLKDSQYCLMHSPEHAQEVQEKRRLGGLRRKRESTISAAYLTEPLTSVTGIRRVLDIAMAEILALENGVARDRILVSVAHEAAVLLEKGEMEERLTSVEQIVKEQTKK
ncbi:MAG: hypothetical protein WB588_01690 [Dehalococcoidia bacterium]